MRPLVISLLIGCVAGLIDILPMMIKKLDKMFILSAFFTWVVVGVITPMLNCTAWFDGLIAAAMVFLPLSFLIWKLDRSAFPQVTATTIVLGMIVGIASKYLISKTDFFWRCYESF